MNRWYFRQWVFPVMIVLGGVVVAHPHYTIADEKGKEAAKTKPKSITTHPDKELFVEKGKGANVTVKVKAKDESPVSNVKIEAVITGGGKTVEISPESAETDADGRAVFTVTGNKLTEKEAAEIAFTTGKITTKLRVKVQTKECKPASIKADPDKRLVLEQGKTDTVTVKVKCDNGSPSVDTKVSAVVSDGGGKIDVSPTAALTDESGKADFTVTGSKQTEKKPAAIEFTSGELKTKLEVKVTAVGGESVKTAGDKPKAITTSPSGELTVELGKSVNVTVKVRGKGDAPLSGSKVTGTIQKGKKAVDISPESVDTDVDGKATFTVTGKKAKGEEPVELGFSTGGISTKLAVKVQTTECKLASMAIEPEEVMVLEQGKKATVTVKAKCENGSPAVDAKINAIIQDGGGKISLSSTAGLTDESGKAVFTVTGVKQTGKELATINFSSGDKKASLEVKVKQVEEAATPKETPKVESTAKVAVTPEAEATPK